MRLPEALQFEREWRGSMDELVRKATQLSLNFPIDNDVYLPESTRTVVMSYRARGILPPADRKRFTWDHLVRLLAARYLVTQGWKREDVAERFKEHSTDYLAKHLPELATSAVQAKPRIDATELQRVEMATIAVQLLAAGIVEQFGHAKRGAVLVQDDSMSQRLTQAMLLLAALFLQEGQDNPLGSVHQLLALSRSPLTSATFGLAVFDYRDFPYAGLLLLDPDRRIPTLDCAELARQSSSELDLREQLAFDALRSASEQLVGRQDEAYADLRLWITEHPVTTTAQLRDFVRETNLQAALGFLLSCYEPVGPRHLIHGQLHLCSACGVPMRRSPSVESLVACTIVQCSRFDKPVESIAHPTGPETLIARPHVLLYWVAPGLDEVALYRKAQKFGLSPRPYPDRDACDISLDGGAVGVDVKSYANPFVLAAALTANVGGLASYPTRIIAINDQALARFHGYLDIVRQRYSGPLPLRFMSVHELMKSLESPF
ncbi:hypothetical protein GCM10027321_28320 [Massilia terrae]|uniref:REase associating with pPIWI RE domain-containing protein n=1 Tax=Massilia terrae TaxID=1811224 RepID=A0ABT2D156_9BURK|nr:hypothetical protein [Massilia terrae]MCS0659770.1 hypothetical protein [Massilia terrae]